MRTIAGVVIASLVLGGMATAQDFSGTGDKVPGCSRPEYAIPVEEWRTLSAEQQQRWCAPTSRAYEIPVSYSRRRSPKLAFFGGLTLLTGLIVAIPSGQHYQILGEDYCVTDYAVDYGDCWNYSQTRVLTGIGIAGAGALMMGVGLSHVRVSPSIVGPRKGAAVAYRW